MFYLAMLHGKLHMRYGNVRCTLHDGLVLPSKYRQVVVLIWNGRFAEVLSINSLISHSFKENYNIIYRLFGHCTSIGASY